MLDLFSKRSNPKIKFQIPKTRYQISGFKSRWEKYREINLLNLGPWKLNPVIIYIAVNLYTILRSGSEYYLSFFAKYQRVLASLHQEKVLEPIDFENGMNISSSNQL